MTTKSEKVKNEIITEMAEAGVLYSHKRSKADPRMDSFVVANRYQLDVLDAGAVLDSIEKTGDFIETVLSQNGTVLFVGTTPPAKSLIEDLAGNFDQPYVVNRWIGGTITNFDVIHKRIEYYLELKEKRAKGELEKYTKKEQVEFDKEIDQLKKKFGGITDMDDLPDAIFIVNIEKHPIAVKEARDKNIPVIGIIDTNDNPELVDYPIIANDHSRSSLEWVMNNLKEEISVGKIKSGKKEEENEENKKDN